VRVLPPALRSVSPRELAQRIDAERRGLAFLIHLDDGGQQRLVELGGVGSVTIGRSPSTDVPLGWDTEVSRLHAVLEHEGGAWTIVDEGLSRNGSFVNGRRLRGRRRLVDGDAIKVGGTLIVFVDGGGDGSGTTTAASQTLEPPRLSDAQRRVLVSLCGPLDDAPFAGPRSNREIAEDLYLSVETVKTHLRALFDLFAVGDLPQNRKRAELVRRAYESGVLG
jgi:pSer/pThr/pTyr-binding forkhead associated (FHA) protein